MALKEQDIVFTTTDEAGNPVIQFPITRVENVEDAVRTVNKKKPDSNGDIQIDVDMSHLATKDELTKGLANKRDHTIQIANADLNTLLEDKTWACSGTLKNTPIACTFCIVQAYDTGAPVSGNIVQVCYVPNLTDNTVRTFWRNCNNGVTFGKWSESGAVKTVNSIAPDASGEVTLPNATTSKAGLVRLAAEEDVLNEAPQTAVCTQLIYEINEFRRKSTAYQVGDKVDCAFQYERFLECTKAGKTSAELLDTRNVTHGQVIADGMVEWTVRTHVRSVNGNVAGADGNVLVDVGAKTVNGNTPDSNGNVSVDVGVKTVNGKGPDSKGNVSLGLHAVATSGNYNDLTNKPSIPATPNAYVTKTWRSGDQWYRRWSDGRLEQGGRIKLRVWTGGDSPNRTFSLPTNFSNATYTTVVTGEEGYGWGGLKTVSQTTNSVTVTCTGASRDDYVEYVHFYCSGY